MWLLTGISNFRDDLLQKKSSNNILGNFLKLKTTFLFPYICNESILILFILQHHRKFVFFCYSWKSIFVRKSRLLGMKEKIKLI